MYIIFTLTIAYFALKDPVTFSPLRNAKQQINGWFYNFGCTFSPKTVRQMRNKTINLTGPRKVILI